MFLVLPVLLLILFLCILSLLVWLVFLGMFLLGRLYPEWNFLCLLSWLTISFSVLGKLSIMISSKNFSHSFFFSSYSGTLIIQMFMCLILSQKYLTLSSVFFSIFTLFWFSEVISTVLSFSSLIHSSVSDILLLIPSRVFLISIFVLFVSVCLFFNYSRFVYAKSKSSNQKKNTID